MDFISLMGKPIRDDALKQCELELGCVTRSPNDDRVSYIFKDGGVSILTDAESARPMMISFFPKTGKSWDGKPYTGALPLGARFGMSRAELKAILGDPTDSRSWWDKWDRGNVVVRAEYTQDGQGPMARFYLLET